MRQEAPFAAAGGCALSTWGLPAATTPRRPFSRRSHAAGYLLVAPSGSAAPLLCNPPFATPFHHAPIPGPTSQVMGFAQEYQGGLTFATLLDAGHSVPWFKPARAQYFVSSWVDKIVGSTAAPAGPTAAPAPSPPAGTGAGNPGNASTAGGPAGAQPAQPSAGTT